MGRPCQTRTHPAPRHAAILQQPAWQHQSDVDVVAGVRGGMTGGLPGWMWQPGSRRTGTSTIKIVRPAVRGARTGRSQPALAARKPSPDDISTPLTCGLTSNELVFDNRRGGERACGNRVDADGAAWAVRGSRDSWARRSGTETRRPWYPRPGCIRSEY